MNIFVLDSDPVLAAQYMCNKHIVKMILETRELMEIAHARVSGLQLASNYKRHWNHPCAKWAAASLGNYEWLMKHGLALCDEYTYRYRKMHKYDSHFRSHVYIPGNFKVRERTPFVQCMLPEYFDDDPVTAYRNYYLGVKTHLLKYTRRTPPEWMQALELGEHIDNASI